MIDFEEEKVEPVMAEQKQEPINEDLTEEQYQAAEKKRNEFEQKAMEVAYDNAAKKKPQEVSQTMEFSKKYNLPVEFVERNKDLLLQREKKKDIDFKKIQESNPSTARILQDKNKAAVAQDDIPNLASIEDRMKLISPEKDEMNWVEEVWHAGKQSVARQEAGAVLNEGLRTGQDINQIAANVAYHVNRERELRKDDPRDIIQAQARIGRKGKKVTEDFSRLMNRFDVNRLDKILDGLGPELVHTASDLLDYAGEMAKNPRAMVYGNTKSIATGIRPMVYGTGGLVAGTALATFVPFIGIPVAVAGATGAITGYFVGGVESEVEGSLLEQIESAGYDTGDVESLKKAFNDKNLMSGIYTKAQKKAYGTQIVDTGLTLLGAKMFKAAGAAKGTVAKIGKGAQAQSMEVLSEMGGEAGGQLWREDFDFSKLDANEILAEGQNSILGLGGVAHAAAFTVVEGTKIFDGARVKKYAKEEIEKIRNLYPKDSEAALKQMGQEYAHAKQAITDYQRLDGLFNDMENLNNVDAKSELVKEFTEDAGKGGKVYYNTSDDFDYFAKENGVEPAELLEQMSEETQRSYADSKAKGQDFEMKASEYASIVAAKPELREMNTVVRVRKDGVNLAEANMNLNRAEAVSDIIAQERKEARKGEKKKQSNKSKIRNSLAAKIQLAGFTPNQASSISTLKTSFFQRASELLREDIGATFGEFTLDYTKKPIESKTKKAILDRAKLEERAKIGDMLEGITEEKAQVLAKQDTISIGSISDNLYKLHTRDIKHLELVALAAEQDTKFGNYTKPVAHDKLPNQQLKEIADEMVEVMIEDMTSEIERAEKGSALLMDRKDGKKEKVVNPSTYPKDYRKLKVGKAENYKKAIEKFEKTGKKNALYKRIEKVAADRLVNGYESQESGQLAPNNTYRTTVGMSAIDETGKAIKPSKTLFAEHGGRKTGQINIVGRNMEIDVFAKGDVNTMLHETGHAYLEIVGYTFNRLKQMDNLEQDQLDFVKDGEALLEYLGADSFDNITEDQHELFADTFHSYVGTGKAPSAQLQTVFYRFKNWVIGFFKDARNAGVEITPEIESFMGGLMASREEIMIAKDEYSQHDAMTEAMILGMNDKDAQAYVQKRLEARMSQENALMEKLMGKERKKEQREKNKYRASFKAEVEAEVEADPRYKAVDAMRDRSEMDMRMSKQGIQELMGKGYEKKVPKGIYSVEGGFHPDEIAQMFGFVDGFELLESIEGLPNKQEYIKEETEARLDLAFSPFMKSNEELQQMASDAIANEKQAELYRMEIDYWLKHGTKDAKKAIKRLAKQLKSNEQLKAEAKQEVANSKVSEIVPYYFAREAKKQNGLATEAFLKGRFEDVVKHKILQLEAIEKQREAKIAREYIDKSNKRFKRLKKVDSKKIDVDLVNGARQILERVGLGVVDAAQLKKDLITLEKHDDRKARIISNHVNKLDIDFKDSKELTFKEYESMAETVKALVEMARDEKSLDIDGQKIAIEDAALRVAEQVASHKNDVTKKIESFIGNSTYGKTGKPTTAQKIYDNIMSFKASMRRVEHFGTAIDLGDKVNGAFTNYIVKPVIKAVDKQRVVKAEMIKKYETLVKARQEAGIETEVIDGSKFHKDLVFKNKIDLLGFLIHIGNESNKSKLLIGHEIGFEREDGTVDSSRWDAFFQDSLDRGVITKADMDFIQGIWNLMEELKPEAQKAHKRLEGRYFDEIEATEIETPFGSYRGGYAPITIDGFYSQNARIRMDEEALLSAENSFMWPSSGKGFTISREGHKARISTEINVFASHLDKVTRYTYIQPAVQDSMRLINNEVLNTALSQYDKYAYEKMLVPWLQRAASQRVTTIDNNSNLGLQNLSKIARANVGMQRMALNIVNTLQQLTGFSISAARVGKGHLWQALTKYSMDRHKVRAMVNEKSDFMKERVGSQMVSMTENIKEVFLERGKVMETRDKLRANAYIAQEFTQNFVDTVTWLGAYDEAIAKGLKEEDAVWTADSAVRETQGSFSAEDISSIEAGSPYQRIVTMFYSYFNMQANLLGTEFATSIEKHGLKNASPEMIESYFYIIMLPAFISELMIRTFSGKFDEDDDGEMLDEFAAMMFNSTVRSTTALVPLYGQVGNAFADIALDKKWAGKDVRFSPVFQAADSLVKTGSGIFKAMKGDRVNDKYFVSNLLESLGLVTGVPVAPLGKPYRYLRDMQTGKAQPDGNPLEITRGIITGKSGQ